MYRVCIAVADASRARLFTFERTVDARGLHEQLIEQRDLINPARRLRQTDLFSNTRPGVSRSGSFQYGLDDHREAHIDRLDSEFAQMVVSELDDLLKGTPTRRVIMCASPRMLGELRDARHRKPANALDIDEVPHDLVKLRPAQLRDQLASYGLLPPAAARA